MILEIFILALVAVFAIAYALRDKTQDQRKEQQFTNSICGGPLDL
jgi:hypothetical protein